jgi:hypothetical protein
VGLRDVTGVFSRYFIVGFFLPVYFSLLTIWVCVGEAGIPSNSFGKLSVNGQVVALGAVALLVGLLLLGLRHPTWQLFQGVVSERAGWRWKTAFGASSAAYHARGRERWGLDVAKAWPLIAPLLTEGERELHTALETDARLFLNGCVGSLAVAAYLLVDGWGSAWSMILALAIPIPLAYGLYRGGVMAADRWGEQKLASGALHRHELYERVGIPADPDEREAGRVASGLVSLPPQPLPFKKLWSRAKPGARRTQEPSVDPRA